ncbi:hypothetical protein FACS1894153_0160 [Bacteroidia bacterium]|nr:hypothetical protein FACS1894153_0160 [Bacteroidia bacterium]
MLKKFCYIFITIIILLVLSCKRDYNFNTDPNFKLSFSNDTVAFDTVFTSYNSVTKILKVYNNSKFDVKINKIRLENGSLSFFRINVNGDTSAVVENIVIREKDSMFVFVKVLINPDNENNPFEIVDNIIFEMDNISQKVVVTAFGQNAYYHFPDQILFFTNANGDTVSQIPYSIVDCDEKWKIDKPHIVYGFLVVYTDDVFTLDAGTHVHFANGAGLWIYNGGSLKINGSLGNEVIFSGMRLDSDYKNMTGQWERIWLSAGSVDNEINYAIIKNGSIGILVDTVGNSNPTLVIRNSIIKNMQQFGIVAQGAVVEGENLVISSCGEELLALTIGGKYSFSHCTFANYFGAELTSHNTAAILINNYYYYQDANGKNVTELRPVEQAIFNSCVIDGSLQDEISFDLSKDAICNYEFKYCAVKINKYKSDNKFTNCLFNQDPMFSDKGANVFAITAPESPLIGKGMPSPYGTLSFDIRGVSRPYLPTIGAYEF